MRDHATGSPREEALSELIQSFIEFILKENLTAPKAEWEAVSE